MESTDDETSLSVRQAFGELQQILYWHWDPLGVNDAFPDNDDEYGSYARMLLSALYRGLPDDEIAAFLQDVAGKWFGHSTTDELAASTAERVAYWRSARGIGDADTSPPKDEKLSVYAVVRIDPGPWDDPAQRVYVREILPTRAYAVAEAERLNRLAESRGLGSTYHWQTTRFFPRGRDVDEASS